MLMTAEPAPIEKTKSAAKKSLLSEKPIPRRERLIFALDFSTIEEAKAMVERLGDSVLFYKLGLFIFMSGDMYELIEWLRVREKKVFVDIKFFDVPETVRSAFSQLKDKGISFATVHGNDEVIKAVVAIKNGVKILAVTVLTSLDEADLKDLGFKVNIKQLVLSRARRALDLGCDGVISSGLEVGELRKHYGETFTIVSPGIRPVANRPVDDQKRVATVEEAFRGGADYIVVGRPIRDAVDPKGMAEDIQRTIETLFEE